MPKKASGNFDQKKYVAEFQKSNYDRIGFDAPKGSREKLQIAAAANNISMAQLIITALEKQYGISLKKEK